MVDGIARMLRVSEAPTVRAAHYCSIRKITSRPRICSWPLHGAGRWVHCEPPAGQSGAVSVADLGTARRSGSSKSVVRSNSAARLRRFIPHIVRTALGSKSSSTVSSGQRSASTW
jgi:hypothetical protein